MIAEISVPDIRARARARLAIGHESAPFVFVNRRSRASAELAPTELQASRPKTPADECLCSNNEEVGEHVTQPLAAGHSKYLKSIDYF